MTIDARDIDPNANSIAFGLKIRPDGQADIKLSYTQRMHILFFFKRGGEGEFDYEKLVQDPDTAQKTFKQFGATLTEHIRILTRDGIFIEEKILGSEYKVRKRLTQLGRNLAKMIDERHSMTIQYEAEALEEIK